MLHVKVQLSPGLGVLLPPSEQLITPLVGAVSDGQVTNNKKAHYIATYINNTCKNIIICDCLSKNPPSLHLPVFQEIPF